MFIVIVNYKKPMSVVEQYLAAHREFLDRHFATGVIITSGPQVPRTGGIYMLRTTDREAAERLVAQDPFYVQEIADYKIIEFTPTKFADTNLKSYLL